MVTCEHVDEEVRQMSQNEELGVNCGRGSTLGDRSDQGYHDHLLLIIYHHWSSIISINLQYDHQHLHHVVTSRLFRLSRALGLTGRLTRWDWGSSEILLLPRFKLETFLYKTFYSNQTNTYGIDNDCCQSNVWHSWKCKALICFW